MPIVAALGALIALVVAWFAGLKRLLNRDKQVAQAKIVDPDEHTTMDDGGAVRSIQAAELTLPLNDLDELWSPETLERLARTYWRYLNRATLGVIRVLYSDEGRRVVVLFKPFTLLRFGPPEYEMDDARGIVRWRIEAGVLVAARGHGGDGYLEIDVERCDPSDDETGRLHVEVEVANFYPSLASSIANWFYVNTQSRIHVLVTHGFLRSLARLDLAESRVGRYKSVTEVPDPPPHGEKPSRERPVLEGTAPPASLGVLPREE